MSRKILYGLDNYFDELTKLFNNGKFPKVIMFSGNKGQGKFTDTNIYRLALDHLSHRELLV